MLSTWYSHFGFFATGAKYWAIFISFIEAKCFLAFLDYFYELNVIRLMQAFIVLVSIFD